MLFSFLSGARQKSQKSHVFLGKVSLVQGDVSVVLPYASCADLIIVVALQYYNSCLVLLRQHKPPNRALSGFEAVRERRNVEVRAIEACR